MEIVFLKQAQLDIAFWKKAGNIPVQKKILKLLESVAVTPFTGIGKPEPCNMSLRAFGQDE